MQRVTTTVIGLVGGPVSADLRDLAIALGQAANVRAALPDVEAGRLDRAVAAWAEATRAHIPYLVHDADPLADVAAAWVERWEGTGSRGDLELAVQAVVRRWRARSLELPDYYLVVDAESLPATRRHWYLGVLANTAPHRVAVTPAEPAAAARAVRGLRAGRWWPDLDRLLEDIGRRSPDEHAGSDPAPGLVL